MEKMVILDRRKKYLAGNENIPQEISDFLKSEAERIKSEECCYEEVGQDIEKLKKFYEDTLVLAKSYRTSGGEHEKSSEILKLIEERLSAGQKYFYNKTCKEYTNWWVWEIDIPMLLNDIFVLTGEDISCELMKEVIESSKYFQPDPRYSGNNEGAIYSGKIALRFSTAEHRAETVKISLIRGILTDNKEEIVLALQSLVEAWAYKDDSYSLDRNGFYRDGSFLHHGSIPYTAKYGNIILKEIGEILHLVRKTEYEKYLIGLKNFYEIIFTSFEPFFFKGGFTDMLNGRGIGNFENHDHKTGHEILNSLLLIEQDAPEEFKERIAELVKSEVEKDGFYKYFENEKSAYFYNLMKELLEKNIETKEYQDRLVICNKMNRIMRRAENYAVGIAMHSSLIGNYETRDGENKNGWFTGDGAYYLYDNDLEQYKDYWKNADYNYIPGTTEIRMDMENVDAERNPETRPLDRKNAAGLKWHYYGAAGMEYENWNGKLTSRKSWFFVSWGVIFAESNIKGKGEVYTTVANRKFKTLPEIKIDGEIFNGEEIKIKAENVEMDGKIFMFYKKTEINLKIEKKDDCLFVKIWVEHGKDPVNSSLVWGLVMNKGDMTLSEIKEKFAVTITEDKHTVKGIKCDYQINWDFKIQVQPFCVIYRKEDNRESRMYLNNY
ncbi:MAG: hypothetical protein KHZ27_03450 [Fusobacterium sp.]|nr:hypothetical protein [Fusobacterium sp.]